MRSPRRPRSLTGEELRLWREIARLITPLRGQAKPKADPAGLPATPKAETRRSSATATPKPTQTPRPNAHPTKAAPKPPAKTGAARSVKLADVAPAPAPAPPRPFKLAAAPKPPGLERRERMGLRRGSLAIDARIDLHGLYQADAHAALVGFLRRAREAGHARVLVVTGKGHATGGETGFDSSAGSERGVLRRSVPHWLRGAELGHLVLGFEEAARHHGGAGALYVRLRRR